MEEKLIYPKILPEEEVIKMIDEKSNKERVTHMQKEFESLEKLKNIIMLKIHGVKAIRLLKSLEVL